MPVLFGSATSSWGVRRLLKALRHEAPAPQAAADRLGVSDPVDVRLQDHATARSAGWRSSARARRHDRRRLRAQDRRRRACARSAPCSRSRARRPRRSAKRATATSSRSPRSNGQGRRMARRGQAAAAGRDRLSRAQLRDRDRTRRPQGRRQAVGRAAAAAPRRMPALVVEHDEANHEIRLQGRQRRASQHRARAAEAPLRRRGEVAHADGRLSRIDPQAGAPAWPPQEAVGRPRPVRRRDHRNPAAAARRRLPVRGEDPRRMRSRSNGSRRSRKAFAKRCARGRWASTVVDVAVDPGRRQLSQRRQLRARLPPRRADRDARGARRRAAASARADAQAHRRLPVERDQPDHLGGGRPARPDARHGARATAGPAGTGSRR